MLDDRLVQKGKREPREGLVQQGNYSLELARRFAAALAPYGWGAADTEAFAGNLARIATDRAAQIDARAAALAQTRDEAAARSHAKAFIRRLRRAVPHALRKQPVEGVTTVDFEAGEIVKQSTPKIIGYLDSKAALVKRVDAALAPYFGGGVASVELAAVRDALRTADAAQEVARAVLPADTRELYAAKGLVIEAITELNACGRSAFEGDATQAALFNKDLLLRARLGARKPLDAPEPETPPTIAG